MASLQSELKMEVQGIIAGIFNPPSFFECVTDTVVATCDDKYLGVRGKSIFLEPIIHIRDVVVILVFWLRYFVFADSPLDFFSICVARV